MPTMPPTFRTGPVRTEADRKREYDQRRGSSASRGYGRRWQASRLGYLKSHPLCVKCIESGVTTASAEVDHIRPHRGDQGLFWDRDNWQALCKSCHSAKTAREDSGFSRGR
ncbi:HNH endonuclease signature motif containing protein [Zavarzinia sp.]|uniref:HNH endonuclease signature motif containing protein n=1 Tax=Zavarzinia sp. TaxID=2027920 RepID=UPI003BB4FEC9